MTTRSNLAEVAIASTPCRGCEHAKQCRDLHLACAAFAAFIAFAPLIDWQQAKRKPDRSTFERLGL